MSSENLRIKELRKTQGLSQRDLARKLGVAQGSLRNWETGRFWPSSRDLPALARVLHCKHIEDLYTEEALR